MADITMPQLGETVTEGTITRWMKQVGDEIAEDEVLFEVSTDKVDSEVPSPAAGVVAEILVPEGETVDVGTRLAVISDEASGGAPSSSAGNANGTAEDAVAAQAIEDAAAGPSSDAAPVPAVADSVPDEPSGDVEGGPQAPSVEQEESVQDEEGKAPAAERRSGGGSTRPTENRPPSRPSAKGGKVLSPVVRRLITEHDLDPAEIRGSGAGGRITRSDVLEVIDHQSAGNGAGRGAPAKTPAEAPDSSPAASAPSSTPTPGPAGGVEAGESDTVVPFTNIRRRTAEHMVRSKHTSAHTMVAIEVDYHAVDEVRRAEKDRFKEAEGFGLTYLPFIARATVDAMEEFPNVNASVGDNALVVHHDLNLGIAVDLDFEGLLVPVIHQADGKRLRQLARDISGLAKKARSRKLTMDDISGGTFTITNAGPFGTLITVPVINQPQVAILSTDGVKKRPVAIELSDGSDGIAIHPVGNLVLSWDHRAFDGAYAAAFLAAIKSNLEGRDWAPEL
ncbi:MAG: 2-oxo acid dehydrogenase subunit E2 [Actinomycetota bacterium]|nr:2-oxo acid dehydrogenase subunit E2 [Actinomycetota bacterium]